MTTAMFAVLSLQLAAGTATGAIAYDSITNGVRSFTVVQTALPWQAEDTTLAEGSELTVTRVEPLTRLSSFSPNPTFEGTITMSVCLAGTPQGSFGQPGAILATASLAHTWTAGSSDLLAFDLAPLTVPSRNLWIIWQFATPGGQGVLPAGDKPFVVQNDNVPTIGTTTGVTAASQNPTGPWQLGNEAGHYRAVRITTVPVPTSLALIGLGGLAASRRMRRC